MSKLKLRFMILALRLLISLRFPAVRSKQSDHEILKEDCLNLLKDLQDYAEEE